MSSGVGAEGLLSPQVWKRTDSQAVLGLKLEQTLSTFCAFCLQFLQTPSLRQSKLLSISGPACEMAPPAHPPFLAQLVLPFVGL